MKFLIAIYVTIFGKKVGVDEYQNSYYLIRYKSGKEKRIVIYKGLSEATKVSPKWEAWLRFSVNSYINENLYKKKFAKYLPNLTGTIFAYYYPKYDSNINIKSVKKSSSWQG